METIDAEWITKRLTGRHGEKAQIARAMGVDLNKFSKILKGTRKIQASEIPALIEFFATGMREDSATFIQADTVSPLQRKDTHIQLVMKIVAPSAKHPLPYKLNHNHSGFDMHKGDVLIVEMNAHPISGDIVITTEIDVNTGETATGLRRWLDPWLTSDDNLKPPSKLDNHGTIAILGKVVGILRGEGV